MKVFGLLGKELSHSFSKQYFSEKFEKDNINAVYENFSLKGISLFPTFIGENPHIEGLNVTIPYKKSILYFLDEVDLEADEIGAVNVIKISRNTDNIHLKGFNTDAYGFKSSLLPILRPDIKKALILGTGGAALAVAYVLKKLGINYLFVSRTPAPGMLGYNEITDILLEQYRLVVNATPLGTVFTFSDELLFPTQHLTRENICYDLVYNPEKTKFLLEAERRGAVIKNGYEMLILQAEKAWEIWNS